MRANQRGTIALYHRMAAANRTNAAERLQLMARTAKALTLAQIKKLPPGQHAVGGPVPGLQVFVGVTGRRWRLRRWVDGKQRQYDLGTWDELPTLEAAQARAAALGDSLEVNAAAALERSPAPRRSGGDNPFLGPIARELLEATR